MNVRPSQLLDRDLWANLGIDLAREAKDGQEEPGTSDPLVKRLPILRDVDLA
jgi:hypothetical protein